MNKTFYDSYSSTGLIDRKNAIYNHLKLQREGEVHMFFAQYIAKAKMFHADPGKVEALRVHRFLPVPPVTNLLKKREEMIVDVAKRLNDPKWKASEGAAARKSPEIDFLVTHMGDEASVKTSVIAVSGLPTAVTEKKSLFGSAPVSQPMEGAGHAPVAPSSESASETAAPEKKKKPVVMAMGEYVPKDVDTDVVPEVQIKEEGPDVTKLVLPDDISSYIESMAGKLNEGLGDKSSEDK